jgi:L-lactate dehydrogenase complex protein LldF
VCPVRINIPELLLHLRSEVQELTPAPKPKGALVQERTAMRLWAWAMKRPLIYKLGGGLARWGQRFYARGGWIGRVSAYPLSRWTEGRDLPALAPKSFHTWWRKHEAEK